MTPLFSPFQLGAFHLNHRVVLAPMTRLRTRDGDIPDPMVAEFYAQRATEGGLLIAESANN